MGEFLLIYIGFSNEFDLHSLILITFIDRLA